MFSTGCDVIHKNRSNINVFATERICSFGKIWERVRGTNPKDKTKTKKFHKMTTISYIL